MRLSQGIARAVMLHGDSMAIVDGALRFTWREFADRVARLAQVFREAGLKEGGRVVLLALNSHWSIEAFYAAFHAGGVIVPLLTGFQRIWPIRWRIARLMCCWWVRISRRWVRHCAQRRARAARCFPSTNSPDAQLQEPPRARMPGAAVMICLASIIPAAPPTPPRA